MDLKLFRLNKTQLKDKNMLAAPPLSNPRVIGIGVAVRPGGGGLYEGNQTGVERGVSGGRFGDLETSKRMRARLCRCGKLNHQQKIVEFVVQP